MGERNGAETHTNSVNDLMNHDFGKLELFMLLIVTNILCDHCNTFSITVHAGSAVESIAIVIPIESTDPRCLTDTSVSFPSSFIVLVS